MLLLLLLLLISRAKLYWAISLKLIIQDQFTVVKPVGDALEVITEVGAGEVANSDAVVDVQSRCQIIAASLDESKDVELVSGRQQSFDVFSGDVCVTGVRVVDDKSHHV